MIVVDIDGTITRSDVPGLLMTITPGLIADHMHSGICELLTRIVAEVRYGTVRCGCIFLAFWMARCLRSRFTPPPIPGFMPSFFLSCVGLVQHSRSASTFDRILRGRIWLFFF